VEELWTIKQVAEFLKLKQSTIYAWAQAARIPAIKMGRTWRFSKEAIVAWLEQKQEEHGEKQ